jgi:type IV secretory pathway VirB3-like protein
MKPKKVLIITCEPLFGNFGIILKLILFIFMMYLAFHVWPSCFWIMMIAIPLTFIAGKLDKRW